MTEFSYIQNIVGAAAFTTLLLHDEREGLPLAEETESLTRCDAEAGVPPIMGVPARRAWNIQTFSSLRHRNFALFWVGFVLSFTGSWVQIIAQSLLVLQLTNNSGAALGLISFTQALPFLIFALLGGEVADQINRRRLLLFTQSTQAALAFLLGVLTLTGVVQLWHIVAISLINGITLSFDQPARYAMLPSLVPRKDLLNAVSLQATAFSSASIIGPTLGGILVVTVGFAGNFFINGISFVAVLIALLLIRWPAEERVRSFNVRQVAVVRDIRADLSYVWKEKVMTSLLLNYAALLFFGSPYSVLLSLFAVTVLQVDATGYGVMLTVVGVGTIIGSLGVASLGDYQRKGQLVVWASLAFALVLLAFSVSRVFWLVLILLGAVGAAQSIASSTTVTLLQLRAPRQILGFVMSLNTLLIMGVRPAGGLPFGVLSNVAGAAFAIGLGAALSGLCTLYIFTTSKSLRSA